MKSMCLALCSSQGEVSAFIHWMDALLIETASNGVEEHPDSVSPPFLT